MQSIVFFGKGGIGKSTIASNVSVLLAAEGAKVLHVGCDPKGDSTLSLAGRRIPHFAEGGVFSGEAALRASIHPSLFPGISCVEAGGPQAGVGCAGAGIGAMLDIMKEFSVLEKDGYGAAVFDVLGDVVCGGFAAPLRRGLAGKAVIVVSEELLSIYAANKLVGMINNYSRNGVWLAGLAVNAKDPRGVRLAEAFAAAARTRVLGVIPRDPAVARAESMRKPVAACEPGSPASAALARLVAAIRAAKRPARPPEMLGDEELQQLFSSGRAAKRQAGPSRAEGLPPAEALRRAGFQLKGLSGDQVVCSWTGLRGSGDVYIAPLDSAREGMARFSDWAVCFGPGGDGSSAREELEASAAAVSFLKFEEIIRAFGGRAEAAGQADGGSTGWNRFVRAGAAEAGGRVADSELELGQWSSFILPGAEEAYVPPGTVLLEHGDEECRFSSCEQTPLSAYQKARGGLTGGVAGPSGPALPKETELLFSTGFTYAEAVKGDSAKVERSLAAAAQLAGRGGLVEFYNTCSPMLLATDLAPCVEKAAAGGAVEIVRENFNTFNSAGPEKARARAAYMARRLHALGKTARRYDVNLAWQGASRSAVEELLSGAGLSFAPAGGDPYSAMAASALQVLPAPDPVCPQAFDAAGLKWASPPAPYGLAGSRLWLECVFKALGRKPGRRAAPPADTARDYARLAAGSAGCSAIFVCEGRQLARLDGGALTCGVPVLSFLAEAGFSLFFLAHEKGAAEARAALRALPANLRGARLRFFRDPAGLRRLLAAGGPGLVYSDIPLDPRAAAAGRTSFSSAQFSPGFAGAVATLDLLLRFCRWDFNAKYIDGKDL